MGSTLPCGEATPMEETVQALLDMLVSPLLPKFSSNRNPPAKSLEESIGKQMHAVVLLYNYFHRKQFPEVEFLDYQAFIKVAVIAKKMLLSFVNCGQGGQKTITEKMIMEAFDICNGLNALTSLPRKDSWPVSKVSVLLVDTAKQNFLLEFGSVIHGVWSLIEKDITTAATHASGQNDLEKQITPAKKIFRGTTQSKQASSPVTLDEEALLQVAHSAVNDKTGLDSSCFLVLQRDNVDSLSKVRSTTRFYLMQCLKEPGEQLKKVPIKDALNSLQSSIVAKASDGYETTEAVTFFQLFPYEKIISDWMSRESVQSVGGPENITTLMDSKVQSVTSPDNPSCNLKGNKTSNVSQLLNITTLMDSKVQSVTSPDNSSCNLKGNKASNVSRLSDEDSKSLNITENHATNENGHGKVSKKKKRKSQSMKMQVDHNVEKLGSPENINSHSLKKNKILNETAQSHEISNTVICSTDPTVIENDYGKGAKPYGSDAPSKDSEPSALLGSGEVPFVKDSFVVAEDQVVRPCCKQLEPFHNVGGTLNSSENVTRNEFGTKKPPMMPQIGDISAKPSGELGVDFSNQDELAKSNLSVLQFEDHTKKGNNLTMMLSSKEHALLQTAVKVLHKKHAKLVHEHRQLSLKQRQVEDAIFLCEKQIQTIMAGGDEASTLIIETVIEGCDVAPSEEETLESHPNLGTASMIRTKNEFLDASSEEKYAIQGNKRKRLSEAILNLYSPCQDLDEICRQNNWVLPTYTVFPSRGGFVASVTVNCLDLNCSGDGDIRSKPQEARESAATCMLNKLRDMAHHV
ncbi:uncharacterized protein LOC116251144 [Nymphaea colorata]|nr:uncharacterized protein LOC116251144 [Nymphaea colorata]